KTIAAEPFEPCCRHKAHQPTKCAISLLKNTTIRFLGSLQGTGESPMRNTTIPTLTRRLLIGCTALASSSFGRLTQADPLEEIKDSSSVRIGYANETPFAYTALDGSVTGESPEIVRKVFERMQIDTIKPVLTEWGSLIPGLRAGRFDLIAAGMYITPERCKQ